MILLLDTHALVWWVLRPKLLSPTAFQAIKSGANTVLVSAVTAYEIEYKRSRDNVLAEFPSDLDHYVTSIGFEWLPIAPLHMIEAGRLPMRHRDPWDRVLTAQAMVEDVILITIDQKIASFGIPLLW